MKTVSLCMIVKNEEDTLSCCLESVSGLFDEIIIVDTGSADGTKKVAAGYTDKIYDFQWIDDFAAARNYAFSLAACDYIMWLDADDIILPEDREKFLLLKRKLDGKLKEVAARYNVGFDKTGRPTMTYYRERIVLRSARLRWSGRIHETLPILEDCYYADFAVTHKKIHPTETGRNLRIYESMLEEGEELDARATFYFARELYYNGRWEEAADTFSEFLERSDGFVENKIEACLDLAECNTKLGKPALSALWRSFDFDAPRAEICCAAAEYFFVRGADSQAVYWYKRALEITPRPENGGFMLPDSYGYIPAIQLCVLNYRAGDLKSAQYYNELASSFRPDSEAVAQNRLFFRSMGLD